MAKKTNFGADFGLFGPNLDPKNFHWFYLFHMLDIVASYHPIQCQVKLLFQTQENDEKPHFGPDLGPLHPNSGCQFFLQTSAFFSH